MPSSPVVPSQRSFSHPVLRFNLPADEAQLTLPTPVCPVADPGCVWRLIINEPEAPGAPIVGTVTGTSGVLTLAFPVYCGVIQADAQLGPVWVQKGGIRHKIDNCTPTTTTTTSTSTSTTTTTTTTSTTLPVKPVVSATSTTPTTSVLPYTAATTATTAKAATTAAAAQLPFTGLDIRPMILLGTALILFGGLLLTTMESRRRALRRASAIRLEHLKEGTRRTSSWFFGQ